MRSAFNSGVVSAGVAALLTAPALGQAQRAAAAFQFSSVTVPTTQAVALTADLTDFDVADLSAITGVGLTGTYVTQQGDTEGGLGPWSLDVLMTVTAPGGEQLVWNPIGGDVTIADYPLSDGTGGLGSGPAGVDGFGEWTFLFGSTESVSNWVYRIHDPVIYLLADAIPITLGYLADPDPDSSWNRPFFIEGVSGLGPVSFDAFGFQVAVTGVYELESVLPVVDDHFTFLYAGGFDPQQPLSNLLDYGLGNGNSPFEVPRGTSRISALLQAGVEYTWVTSQWSAFDPIQQADNTIVGPGAVIGGCPADVNRDGLLDAGDFFAWVGAFGNQDPECDVNLDGACDPGDFFAWVQAFGVGCEES
ncbi:MAG: GC-type dockerin domain-anchored protein [Planctomycetota bacterium]